MSKLYITLILLCLSHTLWSDQNVDSTSTLRPSSTNAPIHPVSPLLINQNDSSKIITPHLNHSQTPITSSSVESYIVDLCKKDLHQIQPSEMRTMWEELSREKHDVFLRCADSLFQHGVSFSDSQLSPAIEPFILNTHALSYFIDKGMLENFYGDLTPLNLAVARRNLEITLFLLESGASPKPALLLIDPNSKNLNSSLFSDAIPSHRWVSPIETSIINHDIEIFTLLMIYGCSPLTPTEHNTPLWMYVARYGNAYMIEYTLERIDQSLQQSITDDAFFLAYTARNTKGLLFFVSEKKVPLNFNKTNLVIKGIQTGDIDFLDSLIQNDFSLHEAWSSPEIYQAFQYTQQIKVFEYLKKQGIDFTVNLCLGGTVLHAIMNRSPNSQYVNDSPDSIIAYIVAQGVDPNETNIHGNTPLHIAAKSYYTENMIKPLLHAGAKINAQNNKGYTALMIAVENQNYDIAKLLIQLGADVEIRNHNHQDVLMIAEALPLSTVYKKLIQKSLNNKKNKNQEQLNLYQFEY